MAKKKPRAHTVFFVVFWLLIAGVFSGAVITQAAGYNGHRRELARVLAELEREKQAYEDLRAETAYYESDAYIERLAREQLGFVRPDEIVFINIAE